MSPASTVPDGPLAHAPVHLLAGERTEDRPEDTVALCLSGGGYRAMLFHLGALWRLEEAGLLARLDRVSSVSGGSITAAVLGWRWDDLGWDGGRATRFGELVVEPVRALARVTLDIDVVLLGLASPGSINEQLADHYRRHLFGPPDPTGWRPGGRPLGPTLQDLTDRPRFVLNATNLKSGVLWRFSKTYMADYRVGMVERPRVELARAVAASSAFPPVLSPQRMRVDPADYAPGRGEFGEIADLTGPEFREEVVLADGGVYDNLGLETAWKRCRTLLVSDAGGQLQPAERVPSDWGRHMVRITQVIDNQVRELRKRQLIGGFRAGVRDGAYWSLRSTPGHFPVPDPLLPEPAQIATAREVPTRLAALDDDTQRALVNWGYAACDLGLRGHVDPALPRPARLPYPAR